MKILMRVALAIVIYVATTLFVFWVPGSLLHLNEPGGPAGSLAEICALLAAGTWLWLSRNRDAATGSDSPKPPGAASYALTGALVVGAIGFVLGFFGPLIFAPGANQGPMLGLFITGPLGFLFGGIGGFIRWMYIRDRR